MEWGGGGGGGGRETEREGGAGGVECHCFRAPVCWMAASVLLASFVIKPLLKKGVQCVSLQ